MNNSDGFLQDGYGRWVPVNTIDPLTLQRDVFVRDLHEKTEKLRAALTDFRMFCEGEIQTHMDLIRECYDRLPLRQRPKGLNPVKGKGNLTLTSFDGKLRIEVSRQARNGFDERIHIAKEIIDACLTRWTSGASGNIKALVDFAFEPGQTGALNVSRVWSLTKIVLPDADPEWERAMDIIKGSLQQQASQTYIRFYRLDPLTKKYKYLPLDLAQI